ncbi:hypothetical protein [Xenorhabdus sp. KK7.4]|uniref:hypothetical protein n=1 Tax=Xenorhabdus sp. KK7.4 TaxID=1851572 RepID=UPI000C05475C|nr:hypothetical protein [Xenorhabdus sp. KK7.4]PHM51638.1 hypothetical protein Xekk_03574 [Xenorhabdus sp. KK7.4]
MIKKTSFMKLFFKLSIIFLFAKISSAEEIIKYRLDATQLSNDQNYNPVSAYDGSIIYAIPPGGAIAHVEFDDEATHRIDYTDQIELAVDFWRAFIRNIYPQLTIRQVRPGEQANFFIGHSASLNIIAGRVGFEPAIAYIPNSENINTTVMGEYNLANQYGIYIDNFIVGINENTISFIMRTFRDVNNRGEAVKRYMYMLLVRHLGYSLGFVPDDPNVRLFQNDIPWYSPELYYISLNDSATPRLMYRNNTFDYIQDLVNFNDEEDAFDIHDIHISPQEEIVARMCLNTYGNIVLNKEDKDLYQLCNTKKITSPLIARIMAILG